MGARTSGRQATLQMLFALDAAQHSSADRVIGDYWRQFPGNAEGRSYADELLLQTRGKLEALDAIIEAVSSNWRLNRMTTVDRNILRLGAFELCHRPDVPTPVIIDEAVELAKLYGADSSPSFVNGVLDNLAAKHRDASSAAALGEERSQSGTEETVRAPEDKTSD